MLHRNAPKCAMSAPGQIRLSPRPPRCRSGASGSPPIPDQVAATARISGLCQSGLVRRSKLRPASPHSPDKSMGHARSILLVARKVLLQEVVLDHGSPEKQRNTLSAIGRPVICSAIFGYWQRRSARRRPWDGRAPAPQQWRVLDRTVHRWRKRVGATRIVRLSCVNSSSMLSMRYFLSSCVRSSMTS